MEEAGRAVHRPMATLSVKFTLFPQWLTSPALCRLALHNQKLWGRAGPHSGPQLCPPEPRARLPHGDPPRADAHSSVLA